MRTLLAIAVALTIVPSFVSAETISSRDTAASEPGARVVHRGYELASIDPGVSGTLAVGPIDMAGFDAALVWVENLGTATSGACAMYAVRDGDDVASTSGKVALGSTFTVTAAATSFAGSVGRGTATGYNVMAVPRRIFLHCAAAQYARPIATIHAR